MTGLQVPPVLNEPIPMKPVLPGILHLQKMAPRARWCFTSLQGSQGISHSVQGVGQGHPPTK